MALQLTASPFGTELVNAYHRIDSICGSKQLGVTVTIGIYADITASLNNIVYSSFEFKLHPMDLSHDDGEYDKNYTTQIYKLMKTMYVYDLVSGIKYDYTGATLV